MGSLTIAELFPIVFISVLMIVGAVIDGVKLKVPNLLTYPMIVSGWLYWGTQGWSSLQMSLLGALLAGGLVLIPYIIGGMGSGDVKLYAAFGAWMVPLPFFGYWHLWCAFAVSVLLGGVMGLAIMIYQRSFARNLENVREIASDFQNSASLYEIADKAKARKPRLQLLPYGIPLTIGSLGYVAYLLQMNWSA